MMYQKSFWLLLAMLTAGCCTAQSQHLKRQAAFGFRPALVNDSIARAHQLKQPSGMLVYQVMPEGTFAALDVRKDDIVLTINGRKMHNWPDLTGLRAELAEGDPVTIDVWRKRRPITLKGKAKGQAKEASTARYDVIYGEAPFQGGHLRTIVNRPKSPGPHPTLYFIPGYTCASLDNLPDLHPYRKLIDSLAALDYLVFRIEKPGVGDGPHPCKCAETGFDQEMKVFEAGYTQLLKTEGVDREKIFIFGHSMGGVQAPLLAAQERFQPAGIAVYGTVFQSWYEYILNMLRFQQPRIGDDYQDLEIKMQDYTKLFYDHYVLHKPLSDIVRNPKWKALLEKDFALDAAGNILYRQAFYWVEISKLNLTAAWANTNAHVLSIFGGADFEVFNEFSMSEIPRIVNAYHPGNATFTKLEGADHSFIQVGSMEKGAALKGSPAYRDYLVNAFDYRIVTVLHAWMQEIMH